MRWLVLVGILLGAGGCYGEIEIDCRAQTIKQSGVQYMDYERLSKALKECK